MELALIGSWGKIIQMSIDQASENSIWLEGAISVEAALRGSARQVTAVYVQKGNGRRWERRVGKLQRLTQRTNVPLALVDEDFIAARTTGSSHGGVVAEAGPRQFVSLESLVEGVKRPFIVMLDGIEDPYNFGQALRSLYAAGVAGVVVRPRNWFSAAGVVARASAGVSEQMPIAIAETAEHAAETFRRLGLCIAATSNQNAVPVFDANLVQPLFLLLGGEKRGITRSFLAQSDLVLQIPYAQTNFNHSLGVVASAAIVAFEVMRQRNNHKS
ncbi:MAG: 23S rRNA (guanosine(2251)-2'-O)-methyltransferase RlmB [Ardenticatenaceae bacterium]|nr:MAG: 23S rRNA (guanosine(2251)-2'-O)-methyltransferase RlmB [Ardenticatenaceae bacterium]